MSARARRWLALPALAWLVVCYLLPLAQLASVSLQSPYPGQPGYYYRDVNVGNYVAALRDYWPHLGRSLGYAGLATAAAFVLAYPLAYAIAFRAGRWRHVLLVAVVAPFFTSFVLRTVAWRQILADEGPLVSTLTAWHVLPGGQLTGTWVAVVAGLTYNYLPFMVLPVYASLERADPRVLEASADLYAGAFATLRHVALPIARPGVLAGVLLTVIPASGDYVNAEILGSDRSTKMLGNAIESQFFRVVGGYPVAAALSILLTALVLGLVVVRLRRGGPEGLL